jgi:hypothetical protein
METDEQIGGGTGSGGGTPPPSRSKVRPKGPSGYRQRAVPEHLLFVGADRYFVFAYDSRLQFYRYDELPQTGRAPSPIAQLRTKSPVVQLASRPGDTRVAVIAALGDGSIVEVELIETDSARSRKTTTRTRILQKNVGGQVQTLVCTRRRLLIVVKEKGTETPKLHSVDVTSGREARRANLGLASLTSVAALDPDRNDLLLAVDARRGAHVVGFVPNTDSEVLQLFALDSTLRATAIAALDHQWLAVARKGGEVVQLRTTTTTGAPAETAEELCRRLRLLLKRCGCHCHRHPPAGGKPCACCEDASSPPGGGPGGPAGQAGDPGGGADHPGGGGHPGGGQGGRGIADDEPCEERQRAYLTWSPASLRRAGRHLIAVSDGGKRLAVLDRNLNVIFERSLGTRGALVAAGTRSDRLLSLQRGTGRLEAMALDDYVRGLRAVDVLAPGPRRPDPRLANPVVFRGHKSRPASPNPHLRVCVFTVTEPGQAFGDPDQAKMQALLQANVYDVNFDYYWENSFQTLETEFTVFGVHIGAPRPPLVLPRSFASYFFDDYRPGGLEAIMPGNWASPVVFDGTEAMTVHTEPALGTGKNYNIPFAALWTTRTHGAYPIAINFVGTETVQLNVQDQTGTMRNLNVTFGALALNHLQGDDEAAFLAALGQHVTNAIRAAEAAAGSPVVVQDVIFRRIRSNDDDTQFGRLQGQVRVAAGGAQKGRVTLTPPAVVPASLTAIGFGGAGSRSGVLGSAAQIINYFAECLHAARYDAGEGLGLNDPQLDTTVEAEEDTTTQQVRVRINLASNKGGAGAEITLVSNGGLAGTGWPTAVPIAGSDSNVNNRNTMRYHQELANDVFTAAMDHLRATGPWDPNAVRAQFADFDAMMIGFVGACPATVPIADRWNSANAVDFARLRMFVRYHEATDLNSPDPANPVTMGTSLLIGQRFNQFDPAVMSHEVGHGLKLPDLYSAANFRDDVVYIDNWCQMGGGNWRFNHFCGWSKWAVGWIVDDPGNPALNRVVEVPMPAPAGPTTTEAWLYPVEHFDNSMRADVEAEVGAALPIGQMMKVNLGSDGGIVDLIELRAPGQNFSLQLPPTPAVIVTNVLQPGTDQRWAVNGLYRRSVHLLNEGRELRAVGDRFDFATAPEFPVKGTVVELMDLRTIRGGSIPIARVKVVREAAEFIDLYFQDNVPSWKSPDIWVDWPGDNADPSVPRTYPEGTPTDQGETVRFPGTGVEPHFLVVRPHNAGNVHAEDVKVRWFTCDPPGAGDRGRWVQRDTMTLPQINNGTWEIAPFTWNVDPATNRHQCIRAEIIDWTIPTAVDPATGDTLALGSDDVILQNNYAQKNVFDFEAAT